MTAVLRARLLVVLGALALLVAATAVTTLERARIERHFRHTPSASAATASAKVAKAPAMHKPVHHVKTHARRHLAAALPVVPASLHRALERRAVVVVSIVAGGGAAAAAAAAEARAGAAAVGSGYLRVNVGYNGLAWAYATMLRGNDQTPATLVVRRPGTVSVRLDGYNDRTVVAQAARDARP